MSGCRSLINSILFLCHTLNSDMFVSHTLVVLDLAVQQHPGNIFQPPATAMAKYHSSTWCKEGT